jgi:1-piperideine-2-carboxylate/1-pyrroline-2-carboxylate reductase [NAD(P)H]
VVSVRPRGDARQHLDAAATAAALPFPLLIEELRAVMAEARSNAIRWLPRSGFATSSGMRLLSMLAADDALCISKTVTVQPTSGPARTPTINGTVSVLSALDGVPMMTLDAPTMTARRTAAVTVLAAKRFRNAVAQYWLPLPMTLSPSRASTS